MAKKENGEKGSIFGPVSGRLPEGYGNENNAPLRKMNESTGAQQPKEEAAGCPHPKAYSQTEEGPAGRQILGSEMIDCKEMPFNSERARATGTTGAGGSRNTGGGRKSY